MYRLPRNDREYSTTMLDKILSRRRLSFNPYSVSDSRLVEIAMNTGWGTELDIVQISVMIFLRLRTVDDCRKFDGIFFKLGNNPEEIFIPTGALIHPVTAHDDLRGVRSTYGKCPIRNPEDVEHLVGRKAFVSRLIHGTDIRGNGKVAYRLHPLRGDIHLQASTIREAMISAKIEMLQRLLAFPENPYLLSCRRGLIDYEPRVRRAIELIRRFPDTPIPDE